jgi:hypothetical protein
VARLAVGTRCRAEFNYQAKVVCDGNRNELSCGHKTHNTLLNYSHVRKNVIYLLFYFKDEENVAILIHGS